MEQSPESPADMFQRTLHVDADLARKLEQAGYTSIEEVAWVPHWEMEEVTGLGSEKTQALRNLARMYLLNDSPEEPLRNGDGD